MNTLAFQLPTDPGTWAVVLAVFATAYLYLKARKNTRRDPLAGPAPFSSLSTQRRIENQMTELLVELEKMSRQMNAQLDTRAAKLEELIRQADERLEALRQAGLGGEAGTRAIERELRSALRIEPREEFGPDDAVDVGGAGGVGANSEGGRGGGGGGGGAPIPIDPRHAMVYRLADQGRSAGEIAREVGQPAGEVELILALRRKAR